MSKNSVAAIVLLVCSLGHAVVAHAQSDFSALPIDLGDQIYVVHASGVEVGGHVTGLTPTLLTIGQYQFTPEPGLKIERSGDPLWNGIAIGGGIGALLIAPFCAESECLVGGVVTYGLLGALVDWAHVGRTKIFQIKGNPAAGARTIGLAPILASDRNARSSRINLAVSGVLTEQRKSLRLAVHF